MLSLIIANNDVAVVVQAIGLNLLFNLNQNSLTAALIHLCFIELSIFFSFPEKIATTKHLKSSQIDFINNNEELLHRENIQCGRNKSD